MSKVLDLDLDFFVYPVVRGHVKARPLFIDNPCASSDQVREYLERQCGLSRTNRLPGRFCKKHDGAFYAWKKWLAKDDLDNPFEVAHLDGHSDLSFGDSSCEYVLKTTLALPADQRSRPPRKIHRMNDGSYLTFAIANRWVERLLYVYPVCPWSDYERRRKEAFRESPRDLSCILFKDQNPASGAIQLRHLDDKGFLNASMGGTVTPIKVEPEVPFFLTPANRFLHNGFTHMILAHSEKYCPPEADNLIPVIREYFYDAYGAFDTFDRFTQNRR
jgi:hypothetical protein